MSFDERIHEWLAAIDGDLIVPVEAGKLVASADRDELADWLWERREQIVSERMGDIARRERSTNTARRKSRLFAEAVASGDVSEFVSILDDRYVVDDEQTRRPLREMTWADLDFAAVLYEDLSNANAMEAAFLRAVQKKLGKTKTVGERFTDEQLRTFRIAA